MSCVFNLWSAWWLLYVPPSGFGGLGVSMLASDRGFAPDRSRRKHAFLRRGSKIKRPMSQLWGM
jgi:hypothetical protein